MSRGASNAVARWVTAAVLGCLCTLVLLTALAPSAHATRLSEDKARAEAIADEIGALDSDLAGVVEAYEAVSAELEAVKKRIAKNQGRLEEAQAELEEARQVAGDRAAAMYKERRLSLVDVIVGSNDFDDLVAQMQFLVKLGRHEQDIMAELEKDKAEVKKRRRQLLEDREAAETAVKKKRQERERVKGALAERQSTLNELQDEIDRLEERLNRPVVQSSRASAGSGSSSGSTSGGGSSGSAGQTPSGGWWPLIRQAAAANGVDANGMYRLMMMESSGNPNCVGFGLYHGLFQYSPSLWASSWNPHRSSSIYDGAAQIQATALALKMGKGPHWWPNTYGPSFGGG